MKTSFNYLFILIFSLLAFFSCKKEEEQVSCVFPVNHYNFLEIKDLFTVNLVQDSVNKIIFRGTNRQLDKFNYEYHNDTFSITCNTGVFSHGTNKPEIEIHFDSIAKIDVYSPSDVYSTDTIKQPSFIVWSENDICMIDLTVDCIFFQYNSSFTGSGNITLRGKTEYLFLNIHNSINIFGSQLESQFCQLYCYTVGDVYLNVAKEIDLYMFFGGNVYYKGDCTVKYSYVERMGKVQKLD